MSHSRTNYRRIRCRGAEASNLSCFGKRGSGTCDVAVLMFLFGGRVSISGGKDGGLFRSSFKAGGARSGEEGSGSSGNVHLQVRYGSQCRVQAEEMPKGVACSDSGGCMRVAIVSDFGILFGRTAFGRPSRGVRREQGPYLLWCLTYSF